MTRKFVQARFGPMWASAPTKALQGVRYKAGRVVREADPYGGATKGAMGGRPQGSPLRKRYKGCGAKRNPPVTAAPCQPPLGKGDEGTGDADCHGQCAHWLRNDRGGTRGAVGHMGPALQPHIFVGQGPCALPWVRYGIGGRTESSAPTDDKEICASTVWADVGIGPYESVTRGAV